MSIIEKAADFINKGKVKVIGVTPNRITIEVDEEIVIFFKKPGRVMDSCSCKNHSRFCKENPRCAHKLAASTYIIMRKVKWQ